MLKANLQSQFQEICLVWWHYVVLRSNTKLSLLGGALFHVNWSFWALGPILTTVKLQGREHRITNWYYIFRKTKTVSIRYFIIPITELWQFYLFVFKIAWVMPKLVEALYRNWSQNQFRKQVDVLATFFNIWPFCIQFAFQLQLAIDSHESLT